MGVYSTFEEIRPIERTVVLGNFDGVHLGHQALIQLGKKTAQQHKERLMVFTFWPQPQVFFQPGFKLITPLAIKASILNQLGVDEILAVPFTQEIGCLTPEEFVEEILNKRLQAKHIIIGFNYTFGYKGQGTVDDMESIASKYGISVNVLEPYYRDEELVNSSLIRHNLAEGNIEAATKLLGYAPMIAGEVVHGRKLGRTIGIPTANIEVEKEILLPPNGVYATTVLLEDEVKLGVLNIGSRPTVNNGPDRSVEVHILDFDGDLYGKFIAVQLYHKLRPETKFNGLEELKVQINKDMVKTKELIGALCTS